MTVTVSFPSGIFSAFEHTPVLAFIPGNPIIPGNPVIPGNPIFPTGPAAPIIDHLFGGAPTSNVLEVTPIVLHDFTILI